MSRTRKANFSLSQNPNQSLNTKGKPKQFPVSHLFSSLAQENNVRMFNKSVGKQQNLPTNYPQRIELPLFFNTPCRIKQNRRAKQNPNLTTAELPVQEEISEKPDNSVVISCKRRIRDYEMLAYACKRAGKVRDQGRACFSLGVLWDNIGNYKQAIKSYQRFLNVCQAIKDSHGESLAYNCIGVDFQLLGQKQPKLLEQALQYHKKHEELGDINGKFLASINMGLCYDKMADSKSSVYYFQNALKYSVKMANVIGQSMAIGNIGRIGAKGLHDNRDKMKIFLEKYIKLAKDLKDDKGQADALLKLGMLTGAKRSYQQGKHNFQRALQMAENLGEQKIYNDAKCGYGVSIGEISMRKKLRQFQQSFGDDS